MVHVETEVVATMTMAEEDPVVLSKALHPVAMAVKLLVLPLVEAVATRMTDIPVVDLLT